MAWRPVLNERKFTSVLNLPLPQRYEYSIKRMADSEEVWALHGDSGLVLMRSQSGRICVPIWPEEEFAEYSAVKGWEGSKPFKLDLKYFLEKQISGIQEEGFWLSIFPNGIDSIEVEPAVFLRDMSVELQNNPE